MKQRVKKDVPLIPGQKKIDHLDFHLEDFRNWCAGREHEEIGRVVSAIALASEAGDEKYLEQFDFIDRIIYGDGTWRKVIRGSGRIDEDSHADESSAAQGRKS